MEDYEEGLESRKLDELIDLTITDDSGDGCLGLCSPSNVTLLYLQGRGLWFGRMNTRREIDMLLDYVQGAVGSDDPALPVGELAKHAFVKMNGEMIPLELMIERSQQEPATG